MRVAEEHSSLVGLKPACDALGVSRATMYRSRRTETDPPAEDSPRPKPPRSLSESERQEVLDALRCERFVDMSPAAVYATLLDEERYLCSISTMYRILRSSDEVRERRNQLRHPQYAKPELLATAPNELWSWDITKLRGPEKWSYFYLYVIMDVYSRYVVGWMVAQRESSSLATRLITESCEKQSIDKDQLTLHADRGPSMKSKLVAQLLADMGVTKSHSRPHVSDDNPYSESQFKTLKYRPEFPKRFGSQEDALSFCRAFFDWYNNSHRHSGIGLMTPSAVHHGFADEITEARRRVLEAAAQAHPERFVRGNPRPPVVPREVWINPPKTKAMNEEGVRA